MRTSEYQKGLRVSYSSTNTSYTNRILATYSGSVKGGWHYTVSASRRWAEEGHFDGTFYDANSFFLSLEKIMNEFHSLNFVAIYAKNRRGKSSPNTQEVYDLTSENYNSYWGWQGGKKRNSRVKNLGWRIDYNMISESLLPNLNRSVILSQAVHSDHCPVLVEIID